MKDLGRIQILGLGSALYEVFSSPASNTVPRRQSGTSCSFLQACVSRCEVGTFRTIREHQLSRMYQADCNEPSSALAVEGGWVEWVKQNGLEVDVLPAMTSNATESHCSYVQTMSMRPRKT